VQANVGEADKHLHVAEGTRRFKQMTDEAMQIPGVGLVLWPESALNQPVPMTANLNGYVASDIKVPMIIGALRTELSQGRRNYWNSALSIEPGGRISAYYDKVKLLVFGEYVPFAKVLGPVYQKLVPYAPIGLFGEVFSPLPVGPYRLSPDICYEDILPRHIRDLMGPIDGNGLRPHAMVNLTNDSWYGPVEPRIHLALATFRAIEHRRWLVRSTATGISAFIDAAGRLVKTSHFEQAETLVADVPMIQGGATVYGIIGDALGWLALAACAAGLVRKRAVAQAGANPGAQRQAA
jgi:apolipoprotein N-acyltransferase